MGYGKQSIEIRRLMPWFLIGLAGLAYTNSFRGVFLFDDFPSFLTGGGLRSFRHWPPRVVVDVTFWLNLRLFGPNPASFHLVNLAVHMMAGLLLYGIMLRVIAFREGGKGPGDGRFWFSGLVAALWLVHPLQTESVTYICQRYESMMGFFLLLTVYAFLRAESSPRSRLWYGVSLASCVLGMGCKEVMAVAPAVVLVLDWVVVSRYGGPVRRRWRIHLALWLSVGVMGMLRLHRYAHELGWGIPDTYLPSPFEYLLGQLDVWPQYLRLIVWPYPQCLDYGWSPGGPAVRIVVTGAFLSCLAIASVWAGTRRSLWGLAGLWFLLTLGISSSVFPVIDLAFEHRLYLALAAPLAAGVWIGDRGVAWAVEKRTFLRERARPRVALGLRVTGGVTVLAVLTVMTLARNRMYHSELAMWQDVMRQRPENCRAMTALANAFLDAGRLAEAEAWARKTLADVDRLRWRSPRGYRLNPRVADYHESMAWNTLGLIRVREQRYAEAVEYLRRSTRFTRIGSANLREALRLLEKEEAR